ncbi:hypothetical protein T439DRAFT_291022 [Meredithblackwellia eburnea MCA 4105]
MPALTTSITLYQLTIDGTRPFSPAPHCWKTTCGLRRFNVPFTTKLVTLAQLRDELPKQLKLEKVTLPTLIVKEGTEERLIMDSYNIAQYLETTYASSIKSLFTPGGNSSILAVQNGRIYARTIEGWVHNGFAEELRPCMVPSAYSHFKNADEKSKNHFLAKLGQEKMDEAVRLNNTREWKIVQYARARKQMSIIDNLIREREESGESGLFLLGTEPTHADFCIFAFYPYSLTNLELVKNTWRHPSLPHFGKWLDAMLDSHLLDREELLSEDLAGVELLA